MATEPSKEGVEAVADWTKPPFLRRVRIRGYKSIAFCDVRLQPLTILVGRNAAGKSNFLDALAFLRDALESGVPEAVKRRGGWSSVVSRSSATSKIEIEIEAGFTCGRPSPRISPMDPSVLPPAGLSQPDLGGISFTATYGLECSGQTETVPSISRESLAITDETKELGVGFEAREGIIERRKSERDGASPLELPISVELLARSRPQVPLLALLGWQPFVDLGDGLRGMGFYNFHPEALRTLQKPNPGWLMEKDGRNLGSVIAGLEEIDPDAVQRVREYLATIAEEVENFDVVRYGEYGTVRFRLRAPGGRTALEFDAASMSDGTLRALAALLAAFQRQLPTGPTVVGIEEPEAALHPVAMRALVDALDEATQRTQVLLTTHSADLLAGRDVTPGQVLVVRTRGGQTQITPVDPASREIIAKELCSLADLQRMDRLDVDEADLKQQARLGNGAGGD